MRSPPARTPARSMAFETPITVRKALEGIDAGEYVLPAIQRDFVWKPPKICALFDSLMRGYPIGSFLFWQVKAAGVEGYNFYHFLPEYHEKDRRYAEQAEVASDRDIVAILDGQQRLTSLNIGLRGSYSARKKYGRKSNANAYPEQRLYLNLRAEAPDDDDGLRYDFQFLAPEEASRRSGADDSGDGPEFWYPVREVYETRGGFQWMQGVLVGAGIADDEAAGERLNRLYEVAHKDGVINFYREESQDLDKVLDIFVRVNSGGEQLSKSDLLLSTATAGWEGRDAREKVRDLVDAMNGDRFKFNKNVALKSGLVLTECPSIAFRVSNFTKENVGKLERDWDAVSAALLIAAELLETFGFSEKSLRADSVLIPVAYYVHARGLTDAYVDSPGEQADREKVKQWVLRSILKPSGIWGSGLDPLLIKLREVLREHAAGGWPAAEVDAAMESRGKPLTFTPGEIEAVLDTKITDAGAFALLTFLFPHVDTTNRFHLDHVFPRSRLTPAKLRDAGFDPEEATALAAARDLLPNLQLLAGRDNQSKSDLLPAEWLNRRYVREADRDGHRRDYLLGELPGHVRDFPDFFADRRERMRERLAEMLRE